MFKRFGLSAAVLGTVLALASPVAGLAHQRYRDNDNGGGYSQSESYRSDQRDGNRGRLEISNRRYHTQPINFRSPSNRSHGRTKNSRNFPSR